MKHKLYNIFNSIIVSSLTFLFFGCEADEVIKEITVVNTVTETVDGGVEESPIKTSGYVLSSQSVSSTGNVNFLNYFDEKPTGNVDLTQFTSFERYDPRDVYKNFIFAQSTVPNEDSLAKFTFDSETGDLIQQKFPTADNVNAVEVFSDELAAYTVNGERKLYLFNPTTFAFIRQIEMSGAISFEDEGQDLSYLSIIYRRQDNKVFLPLQTNDQNTGPFYDKNSIYVEVIDLNSNSWEKTIVLDNAQYPITRGGGQGNNAVDENGNIYITCQGSYSLDQNAGGLGSRPQIVKIPAGTTEFDASYRFNPANFLGFQGIVAQFVVGTIYFGDGIAYAAVSAVNDSPELLALVFKLQTGTITSAEFSELRSLVLNEATSRWARLDLDDQTASIIDDIPLTAAFSFPWAYESEGKLFFNVTDPGQGFTGYYEHDPLTNSSTNLYNISAGGSATELLILSE